MKGELRMERMNHYSTVRKNPVKRHLKAQNQKQTTS